MSPRKDMKTYDLTILSRYPGKWVALAPEDGRVVGSGVTFQQAVRQAKKRGVAHPVLTGSPKGAGLYILVCLS